MKPLSKSAAVIAKTMHAAMQILRDNDGQMPYSELKARIAQQVSFDDWEKESPSEKTKHPRWEVNMNFYSADYCKAGFIRKEAGTWYLTAEGEKMLSLPAAQIFEAAHTAYRIWKKENNKFDEIENDVAEVKEQTPAMIIADAEAVASDGVRQRIKAIEPYDFQDMVAALLRAMGYYVPFVADKGKDGGIDIVAYESATGIGSRLMVQVKHMPTSAVDVVVVRNIAALLKKDSDIGMVVTSGRFTSEAVRFARENSHNIRCIDGTELVKLWITHYNRIYDGDKRLLPLRPIYFINEEK